MKTPDGITIPTDYIDGYQRARQINAAIADNYIAHHWMADPIADAVIAELGDMDRLEGANLIKTAMDDHTGENLKDLPPALQELVVSANRVPDWVDLDQFQVATQMFIRNLRLVLGAFVSGTLVEGFMTNINRSFFITGRLRDQGVRRLQHNNRHMLESFLPGGMERHGDGFKLNIRLRLVHAQIRKLMEDSHEWDTEAWGVPLSSAHMGMAFSAFSARLLYHMRRLGAKLSEEEAAAFMAVWRYAGHLSGVPETILFEREKDALELYAVATMCEPEFPSAEAIAMAHALIQSSPLVVGVDNPQERQKLANYVFRISRAMIGNEMADKLRFPKTPTRGVLAMFRLQSRYYDLLARFFPRRASRMDMVQFANMLDASSAYEFVDYQMPDHVYAENSSPW